MKLSEIALLTLMALSSDDRLRVWTLRLTGDDVEYRASVRGMGTDRCFTVPIRTFRKMQREGLLAEENIAARQSLVEQRRNSDMWRVYAITDAGRAAIDAA